MFASSSFSCFSSLPYILLHLLLVRLVSHSSSIPIRVSLLSPFPLPSPLLRIFQLDLPCLPLFFIFSSSSSLSASSSYPSSCPSPLLPSTPRFFTLFLLLRLSLFYISFSFFVFSLVLFLLFPILLPLLHSLLYTSTTCTFAPPYPLFRRCPPRNNA